MTQNVIGRSRLRSQARMSTRVLARAFARVSEHATERARTQAREDYMRALACLRRALAHESRAHTPRVRRMTCAARARMGVRG
jgi:ribosomal protein L19E